MDILAPETFDPADASQLDALVGAVQPSGAWRAGRALRLYSAALRSLNATDRREVIADARGAAVEAALTFDPQTARTSQRETCANAANYAVRKFLTARQRVRPASSLAERIDADRVLEILSASADDDDGPDDSAYYPFTRDEVAARARDTGVTLDEAEVQMDRELDAAEDAAYEAIMAAGPEAELAGSEDRVSVDELILTMPDLTPERLRAESGVDLSSEGIRKRRYRLERGLAKHD
jgi:hypothetical protein